jgi:CspA family cold shock protein
VPFVSVAATVREWHEDEGWGVLDSVETPGGCWAHFSQAAVAGYAACTPGQAVRLEWTSPGQDGYLYRAVRFWPDGTEPVDQPSGTESSAAYRSTLTLTFDAGGPRPPG